MATIREETALHVKIIRLLDEIVQENDIISKMLDTTINKLVTVVQLKNQLKSVVQEEPMISENWEDECFQECPVCLNYHDDHCSWDEPEVIYISDDSDWENDNEPPFNIDVPCRDTREKWLSRCPACLGVYGKCACSC